MAETSKTDKKEIKPELHLFILWPRAGKKKEVASHIKNKFDLVVEGEMTLIKESMAEFLSAFYGLKLPSIKGKLGHTGSGPIHYLVVKDNTPNYGFRNYHGKPTNVNTRTFDARITCRNLSGDPDTIHGTINVKEIHHDLPILLGEQAAKELIELHGT